MKDSQRVVALTLYLFKFIIIASVVHIKHKSSGKLTQSFFSRVQQTTFNDNCPRGENCALKFPMKISSSHMIAIIGSLLSVSSRMASGKQEGR